MCCVKVDKIAAHEFVYDAEQFVSVIQSMRGDTTTNNYIFRWAVELNKQFEHMTRNQVGGTFILPYSTSEM